MELRNLLEYSKMLQKLWEFRKNIPFLTSVVIIKIVLCFSLSEVFKNTSVHNKQRFVLLIDLIAVPSVLDVKNNPLFHCTLVYLSLQYSTITHKIVLPIPSISCCIS
jgi:hypothetical protein